MIGSTSSLKPLFSRKGFWAKAAVWGLTLLAAIVCFEAVAWSFRGHFYLYGDEIGNLSVRILRGPTAYWAELNFLPERFYNDRPIGFVSEWLLFDQFGFEYSRQLVPFMAIHFANCFMLFLLARRLGASIYIALAVVAAFGGTNITAVTATYLGAVFDVFCCFFTLACFLAFLRGRRGWDLVSVVLFLLALRSKEYALALPFLLAAFALAYASGTLIERAKEAGRRLWPHFLLTSVFVGRYLYLMMEPRNAIAVSSPYHLHLNPAIYFKALLYYTALAFGRQTDEISGLFKFGALLLGLLAYACFRRKMTILLCLACYVALLSLVCCLPNIRAPFYVYGPQAFLWLAVLLAVERIVESVVREEHQHSVLALMALVLMVLMLDFRVGNYFRDRINFVKNVRQMNTITARDLRSLGTLPGGTHVYLNHGSVTPWLLSVGSADYLLFLNHGKDIKLIYQRPERELLQLYAGDRAEKVFWDYSENGSVRLRMRSSAAVGATP